MTRNRFWASALATVPVLGLLSAVPIGCNARPCPCAVAAPVASTCAPAQSATANVASQSAKPVMVWDGERSGAAGKGWADCQDKGTCKVNLEAKPGVGHGGGTGLEFVAKGKLWMGFGWNWFGWSPADAGTDISKHEKVRFWMKVTTEPGKVKPAPESVMVGLVGSASNGKDATDKVRVDDYVQGFLDGEWHEIILPLQSLRHGKWAAFNASKAWELDIGAWSNDECEYKIYVDEVGFI